MKRFVIMIITAVLCFNVVVPAFAAEANSNSLSFEAEGVEVTVQENDSCPELPSVSISFRYG